MSVLAAISVFRELRDATCPRSRLYRQVACSQLSLGDCFRRRPRRSDDLLNAINAKQLKIRCSEYLNLHQLPYHVRNRASMRDIIQEFLSRAVPLQRGQPEASASKTFPASRGLLTFHLLVRATVNVLCKYLGPSAHHFLLISPTELGKTMCILGHYAIKRQSLIREHMVEILFPSRH
jgi:hypothetical protein